MLLVKHILDAEKDRQVVSSDGEWVCSRGELTACAVRPLVICDLTEL